MTGDGRNRGLRATARARIAERKGAMGGGGGVASLSSGSVAKAKSGPAIRYEMTPTGRAFHESAALNKGFMGVVGNGKTSVCCWEVRFRAEKVEPDRDGVRRSKWLIVRNTFRLLEQSTLQTWLKWFPDTRMNMQKLEGEYRAPSLRNDGTEVGIHLIFYSLDRREQAEGLRGYEFNGCWINEASEIAGDKWLGIIQGRMRDSGVDLGFILDTNPPADSNWYYRMAEEKKPEGWEFFRSPPALLEREDRETGRVWYEPNRGQDPGVAAAENIEHLPGGFEYYLKQTQTMDRAQIRVFLMGEYGATVSGMPVYGGYVDTANYLNEEREPWWGLPIFLGTDYGRTPASVALQVLPDGQIVVYDELVTERCTVQEFVEGFLRPWLVTKFRFSQGARILNFGDPAGMNATQTSAMGPLVIMDEMGVPTVPCPVANNDPWLRTECVAEALRTRLDGGRAGLVLCAGCKALREGFLGKYHYVKANTADISEERYSAEPDKNMWSHVHDALQYAVYGATHQHGEGAFEMGARGTRRLSGGVTAAGSALSWGGARGMVPRLEPRLLRPTGNGGWTRTGAAQFGRESGAAATAGAASAGLSGFV